jgi:3-hydroxyisobutyrate dehydrogenase-like beta-hydroxyacid dehydrogenase
MMSDVSVVGLGAMGAALATVLLRDGHRVTVWNRTDAKAEPLREAGATVATDLAAAVRASPVVLVCVDDYAVTRQRLAESDVRAALVDRVLVQLSTGRPQEARELEEWIHASGAEYLDGAILAYPDQMGSADAVVLVAGREATFRRCEGLLRSLGGIQHVGERVGAASALDCAALSFVFGALLGALHGARICEVEGLPVDEFGSMLAELVPLIGTEVKHLGGRIHADRFGDSQAALRTYAAAAARLVELSREARINADFPAYAAGAFGRGIDAGFETEDLAALIKVMRQSV